MEAFESQWPDEQAASLRWVDRAADEREQEDRVSEMLDCLALGEPLRLLYRKQHSAPDPELQPAATP